MFVFLVFTQFYVCVVGIHTVLKPVLYPTPHNILVFECSSVEAGVNNCHLLVLRTLAGGENNKELEAAQKLIKLTTINKSGTPTNIKFSKQ